MKNLQGAHQELRTPGSLAYLRNVQEPEARAYRREILGIAALPEDSVANTHLGSPFDRASPSALNEMCRYVADSYGVAETLLGSGGTTSLNVPAIMALADEGESVIVGRDAHISVISGLCLSGAQPAYIVPPFDNKHGVLLPHTPLEVAAFLDSYPQAKAVVVTAPTYYGLMGDMKGILKECHERGVVLMVDEAHGAHFHFLTELGFPLAAEDAGAVDVITQSTHKTLSALSQASVIHFNNPKLLRRYEEFQSLGFLSTSFSYLLFLSIEHAIDQMVTEGPDIWANAVARAEQLRNGAAAIPGVRVLGKEFVDGKRVLGMDPTRITLNLRSAGMTGYQVRDRLYQEGIAVELATADTVLLFVSPAFCEAQVDATIGKLHQVIGSARPSQGSSSCPPPPLPQQVLSPREGILRQRERVSIQDAVGRVSAETISCYPPGQAILVAGEVISPESLDYLSHVVGEGGHLRRVRDDGFRTIEVVSN